MINEVKYYAFPTKNKLKVQYNLQDEGYIEDILTIENPDVIHIWGSEFPHSFAAGKVCKKLNCDNKLVVSIQGLVSVYANHYDLGIPRKLLIHYHPFDLLYSHSIKMGKKQFIKRGEYERELFKIATNVIGRTDWDLACTKWMNQKRKYFFCNETLRKEFYSGDWDYDKCQKYSIFISQAYYPIKGFHYLLEALELLVGEFPDIEIKVAGTNFIDINNLKKYILADSYAKYIRKKLKSKFI